MCFKDALSLLMWVHRLKLLLRPELFSSIVCHSQSMGSYEIIQMLTKWTKYAPLHILSFDDGQSDYALQ